MAESGVASRRKSEKLIETGRVRVNGKLVTSPATNVDPRQDSVTFDNQPIKPDPGHYYALHKPAGYTCSASDPHADKLVAELFPPNAPRLFTVGRLDRDSEGLIILTNDGDFAQRIAPPKHAVPKTYHVKVRGNVTPKRLKRMEKGIMHNGDKLKAEAAQLLKKQNDCTWIRITLNEGKKREIRRMCGANNWRVERLIRTAIGSLQLDDLPPGATQPLNRKNREKLLVCNPRNGGTQ